MQNNRWLKLLDYFFVTRPILFFPAWNTLLAGYLAAKGETNIWAQLTAGNYRVFFWSGELAVIMALFAAAIGGSFILNQLQDIESDRRNNKLFLISKNCISRPAAYTESILLIALAIVLSGILNRHAFWLIFLGTVLALIYNFPPFVLKNRPVGGLVVNLLVGWIAFCLGWGLHAELTGDFYLISTAYVFLNTGLYLLTTIPDEAGDRQAGKTTVCVRFGRNATVWSASVLFIAAGLLALFIQDQFLIMVVLFSGYWLVGSIRNKTIGDILKLIKMTIFIFSVLICIKFPLYFFLMVFTFVLAKIYYRLRFQFNYPNFSGE